MSLFERKVTVMGQGAANVPVVQKKFLIKESSFFKKLGGLENKREPHMDSKRAGCSENVSDQEALD